MPTMVNSPSPSASEYIQPPLQAVQVTVKHRCYYSPGNNHDNGDIVRHPGYRRIANQQVAYGTAANSRNKSQGKTGSTQS